MSSELIPVHELLSNGDLLLVQDGNHGGNYPKVDEFVNVGIPLITGACLDRGTIDYSQASYLTRERADMLRVGRALAGDVLLTHKGTMGKTAIVPESEYPFTVLNPQLTLYRVAPKGKLDGRYLKYYFDSAHFQELLTRISSTSTISTLSIREQKQLTIPVPKIATQKSVVEILGSLDDRITLLRETNTTLEAIAQALFKSWFVDFDPVHAKMQGRAPEGMDEATADLFPVSFEESELGEVPKGWSTVSFRKSIDVIGGGTPKTSVTEYWGGEIPWFSVVDAPSASDVFVVDTEKHITEAGLNGSSTKLLPTGTTIISARGTVGRLALTGCPMAMNQSCYGLRGKAGDQYFTYFSTTRLVEQLKQRAHGSVFDTITQETFSGVPICYPATEVILAFEQNVDPLLIRIRENLIQASSLASLRDALLPRLISGQLLLLKAEDQVNA